MFPQYSMFLCGIHFIQTDLREAYHYRSIDKMKIPSVGVFDRELPMPFMLENQYDKKRTISAKKYFRKWAAYFNHTVGVFPLVIKRDLQEYLKTNDTVEHIIKFAFSMTRSHVFCKVFPKLRSQITENEKNSSAPFEHYLEELKRWNFCGEDVAFLNILHQALYPYADEKVHKSCSLQIGGSNLTVPYETEDMCPEIKLN